MFNLIENIALYFCHQLLEIIVLLSVYSPKAAPAEKKTLAMPRAWDQG